jgi:hypothetical protein
MNTRFRRVAVFVGSAAIATGAGIGVAAQGDSSSPDRSSSAPGVTRPQGGPGRSFDISALADELGVSEARLQTALENSRPTTPGAGGPDEMIQALADELGLSAAKVREAFEATLGSAAPPHGQDGGGMGAPPSDDQTAPPASSQS